MEFLGEVEAGAAAMVARGGTGADEATATATDGRTTAGRPQQREARAAARQEQEEGDAEVATAFRSLAAIHTENSSAVETRPLSQTRQRRETAMRRPAVERRHRPRAGAAATAAAGAVPVWYVARAAEPRMALRKAIAMGALAVDRTVGGQYEWRDGGLRWRGRTRTARHREPG